MDPMSFIVLTAIANLAFSQPPVVPTLSPETSASVAAGIVRAAALEKQVQACNTLKAGASTRLDVLGAAMLEIKKSLADLERQLSDAMERRRDARSGTPEYAAAEGDRKVLTAKISAVEKREKALAADEQQVIKTDVPKHQSCIDEALKNLKTLANSLPAKN